MEKMTVKLVTILIVGVFLGASLLIPRFVNASPDTLQEWFDAHGYAIVVVTDEVGIEMFPFGYCEVTVLNGEHGYDNPTGWYISETETYLLFPDKPNIGDTASFISGESFGFYIDSDEGRFFTETKLNADGFDHALVFYNTKGPGYIVAFEDLWEGGDEDYTDRIIEVVITYTIETIVEGNGDITPLGPVVVNLGADQSFTITPAIGYHIEDVLVDTVSIGAVPSYTFINVQADHEIKAIFEVNIHVTFPEGSTVEITIDVLSGSPPCVPELPDGIPPFFVVRIISGSFSGSAKVCLLYDDTGLTPEQEQNLRLYMGACVDFNLDGTVNGKDLSLIKKAIKRGITESESGVSFDVNNDGDINEVDVDIVKQYKRKGLIVNPGRNGKKQARLPWIDITTDINTEDNIICGETDHFSIFGVR